MTNEQEKVSDTFREGLAPRVLGTKGVHKRDPTLFSARS